MRCVVRVGMGSQGSAYMPVTPFLRCQAFDPETVEAMGAAFNDACKALGVVDRADKFAELVAKRVIELAQRGLRTKAALYHGTVQIFEAKPPARFSGETASAARNCV